MYSSSEGERKHQHGILNLPNEILLKVIEEFPRFAPEKSNLRLVSKRLCELATPYAFRQLILPRNLDALQIFYKVMSEGDLLRYVWSIAVDVLAIMPESELESGKYLTYDNDIRFRRAEFKKWSEIFQTTMLKILSQCVQLNTLRMEGNERDCYYSWTLQEVLLSSIASIMDTIKLPRLSKLDFFMEHIEHVRCLYAVYTTAIKRSSSNTPTSYIVDNIRGIKTFHYYTFETIQESPVDKETMEDIISLLGNMNNLKVLKMSPYYSDCFTFVPSQDLSSCQQLTHLDLKRMTITDEFSSTLTYFSSTLQNFVLDCIDLQLEVDRWHKVFGVLMKMPHLDWLAVSSMKYQQYPPVSCNSYLCSGFLEDRQSYKQLHEVVIERQRQKGYSNFAYAGGICDGVEHFNL